LAANGASCRRIVRVNEANAVRRIPIGADADDLYYFTTTARI